MKNNRPYSGSVSLSKEEMVWDIFERDGVWILNRRGSFRRPEEFNSREEAEARLREIENE